MTVTLTIPQRDALIHRRRHLQLLTHITPQTPTYDTCKASGMFGNDDQILDYINAWDQTAAEAMHARFCAELAALNTILGNT